MSAFRNAIVFGASTGIGAELVRNLAKSGVKVAAIARRKSLLDQLATEFPDSVLPVVLDVTASSDASQVLSDICERLGGCDLYIYCAGIMPRVGKDEYPTTSDLESIDVNFTSAVRWLNAVALRCQSLKSGTIVGISSVAGVMLSTIVQGLISCCFSQLAKAGDFCSAKAIKAALSL